MRDEDTVVPKEAAGPFLGPSSPQLRLIKGARDQLQAAKFNECSDLDLLHYLWLQV